MLYHALYVDNVGMQTKYILYGNNSISQAFKLK